MNDPTDSTHYEGLKVEKSKVEGRTFDLQTFDFQTLRLRRPILIRSKRRHGTACCELFKNPLVAWIEPVGCLEVGDRGRFVLIT